MTSHFINSLGYTAPLDVALGGTGKSSFSDPYGVICGGTTSTGVLQNLASLGSSGNILLSNGAGALPSFQALSSFPGAIKQVIQATTTTTYSNATTTPLNTLSANITPTSASNHILILGSVSASMVFDFSSPGYNAYGYVGLKGSISGINMAVSSIGYGIGTFSVSQNYTNRCNVLYYDFPNNVSTSTYTFQIYTQGVSGSTIKMNQSGQLSNIILMEIAL